MAEAESSQEDRTESPSQYRREEFRRQGTVALSKELLSIAVLCSVGGSMYIAAGVIHSEFFELAHRFFDVSKVSVFEKQELIDINLRVVKALGWMVAPIFSVAMVAGLSACLAQVGFYVSWDPLMPKWERLNPLNGISRLLSKQSIVEVGKSFIKMGIAVWVVWSFLRSHADTAGTFFEQSVPEQLALSLHLLAKLFFTLCLSLSVVAILDYGFQRYKLEQQMKMTKQEAKEEFKLREGDPLMKSRIRSVQRKLASRRMMEAVPKADVIVTNPTHLAVALKYDPATMSAPRVVAKGAGVIAAKIREVARFHRVPIVENKPLARALFKEIEIGGNIPKELYKAVAEVLAYVYRLKGMMSA